MGIFFKKTAVDITPSPKQIEANKSHHILESLKNSVAFIAFTPDGTILDANTNFLNAVGYTLDEIKGKHHSIFCDKVYTQSNEYKQFWKHLASDQSISDRFLRFTKDRKPLWLEASYNTVKDDDGNITSIVKIASPVLLKDVFISTDVESKLSENYFDVLPGKLKEIKVFTKRAVLPKVRLKSLNQFYPKM